MKTTLFVLVILSFFQFSFSQTPPDILWTQNYNHYINDTGISFCQLESGDFLLVGSSDDENVFVIKTDIDGDVIWQNSYDSETMDSPNYIKQASHDEFLIIGNYWDEVTENTTIFLLNIDTSGNLVWRQDYENVNSLYSNEFVINEDGTITIGGYITYDNYVSDLILIKTDSQGETLWTETYDIFEVDYCSSILKTIDGFILAGKRMITQDDSEILLVKTDSEGNFEWYQSIGNFGVLSCEKIINDNNNGFILVGNGSRQGYVIKTDNFGNITGITYNCGPEPDSYAKSITATSFGGIAVAGFSGIEGSETAYCWLEKYNQDGDLEWSDTFHGNNNHGAVTYLLINTLDTGYAAFGFTNTDNNAKDFYLVKYDKEFHADFSADHTAGNYSLHVNFTDQSGGYPSVWLWDFTNEGTIDSELQNPSHTYFESGLYTVRLVISNDYDNDTEIKENYIWVSDTYQADFSADTVIGVVPLEVTFTDLSVGYISEWSWDFNNDGIIDSNEQNPNYLFEEPGSYTVSLTLFDGFWYFTEYKYDYISANNIIADFNVEPTIGIIPLSVQFNDESLGEIINWQWDFQNDGIIDSYEQNPIWIYDEPGQYSISLSVNNGEYEDTEIKEDYITVFRENSIFNYIEEDMTLNADTVFVETDVTVLDNVTLTIAQGTTILFEGNYKLNIQGRLLAEGTESDSILFTVSDTTGFTNFDIADGGWGGIRFRNTPATNDSSNIKFCRLEYGKAYGVSNYYKDGGAIYIDGFPKVSISNCNIVNNRSKRDGGGVYCSDDVHIKNCRIVNNVAYEYGGGVCFGYPSPKISNSIICYNQAETGGGGGIEIYGECTPQIVNTIITNNKSHLPGGGIRSMTWSSTKILNSLICNNNNNGIYSYEANTSITNSTITNNQGYGTLFEQEEEWNTLVLDIENRECPDYKQNFDIDRWGYLTVTNSILWGNSTNEVCLIDFSDYYQIMNFFYCDIEGGVNGITIPYSGGIQNYENNILADPLFIESSGGYGIGYDGLSADWSLQSNSPCINHGTPDTTGLNLPDYDLAGNPRIFDGLIDRIDIGAYEFQGDPDAIPDISVDPTSLNFGLCTVNWISHEKSFEILNMGYADLHINSIISPTGFLIKKEGEQEYNSEIGNLVIEVDSSVTINVIFTPTEAIVYNNDIIINSNDPDEETTDFHVTGTGDIWPVYSGHLETDTVWESELVKITGRLTVDNGVTLTIVPGTLVEFQGDYSMQIHGRILAVGTETDSITFAPESSLQYSQKWNGISFPDTPVQNDSSKFVYCKIIDVVDSASGGGFYIRNFSKILIQNCVIDNCSAHSSGGGMSIHSSNIKIVNTIISGNHARGWCDEWWSYGGHGGGISCSSSSLTMQNCLIIYNEADFGIEFPGSGGALDLNNSTVQIYNSTFCMNWEAPSIDNYQGSLVIKNSILWGYNTVNYAVVSYSNVQNGWEGEGNIDSDPLFINPGNDNYQVSSDSPCINTGTPDTTGLYLPEFDLAGNPRIYDDRIDMGCYEWQGVETEDQFEIIPQFSKLNQNYPNPFN
ncbi:MAG: PKD domain-containing protein, partial [Candidatus Cloacimonetes bacterium]|nr:PKD domain-containing protein [Candidatus Cloacimonadota bacterium]